MNNGQNKGNMGIYMSKYRKMVKNVNVDDKLKW